MNEAPTPGRPVRVLIVDDDPLVRSGLRLMLGGAETVDVVADAEDGGAGLALLDRHTVDVILLDLRMPRLDGLATLRLLRERPRPPGVIVLTTFDTDDNVLQALRGGASGFLVKDTPPAEIVRAIELVAAGESMLSPTAARRLIDHLATGSEADARRREALTRLDALSPRDREIALAIAEGKPNATIAAELHLSVATIKSHVTTILQSLRLENRVQIALLVQDARRG